MTRSYYLSGHNVVLFFGNYFKSMVSKFAFLLFITLFSVSANAQVTTNSGSGLNPTYPDLAAAITALNGATISSPVTITLTGNETAPVGGFAITATGTVANTIIINGVTSTITANAALVAGTLTDAIFKIIGGDYITIEGFGMTENAANTNTTAGTNTMTEFGVALFNASATDGCQNITIKTNAIDLDRTYLNTWGVYSNCNHSATAVTTSVPATAVSGNSSGLTIIGNTITDVNNGIVVIGAATANMENDGLVIGGSLVNANTISNFGTATGFSGYVNVSGTINGILIRYIKNYDVSFNTITSSATGNTAGTMRGIYNTAGNALLGTIVNNINNNTISVKSAVAAGALGGIFVEGAASNATTTVNINNNTLNGIFHTVVTTSAGNITVISNTSLAKSVIINNNSISNIENTVVALGTILGVSNNPGTAVLDSTLDIIGNSFSNILNSPSITTAPVSLISSSITPAKVTNINNNTFNNLTVNSSVAFTFITSSLTMPASGSQTVNGNQIVTAFNKTGGAGALTLFTTLGSSPTGTTSVNQNNNFSNITVNGTSGISGWINRDGASTISGPIKTISNNTFSNWTTATGSIIALTENAGAIGSVVTGNTINTMTAAAAVTGISVLSNANSSFESNTINGLVTTGAANGVSGIAVSGLAAANNTPKLLRNKIYDLSATLAGGTVNGISVNLGGTVIASTAEVTIANNTIGDLRAPASTGTDAIRGISLLNTTPAATPATSKINLYYNTLFLNAISSGANFGTTGVYHTYSATPILLLDARNNIIVNTSTANGTGKTVAFRRSAGTDLNNYATTSNNNLFYAGVPGVSNLIYSDGTNSDQTLVAFKTRVSTRETASISENPTFVSTVGANSTFLHINTVISTEIEAGGQVLAAVTTDFDGDTRNATTPDIGADEFAGNPSLTTWSGLAWSRSAPTSSVDAVIAGNYSEVATIAAKTLTINNNAIVTIPSGTNVTVDAAVTITAPATFTLNNNANLIQNSATANTGVITVNRNSSPLLRLDYTLWSSPVASQNLAAFSPLTSLAPSRFYTFDTTFNTGGVNGAYAVITDPTIATFSAGAGYLIRMPNTADAVTPTAYAGQFIGIPNNGDVPVSLVDGAATGLRYNLVGNPYPSAISMQKFVFNNTANIENTLWFWRKTNGAGTAYCTWQAGLLVTDPGTFVSNGNTQTVNPLGIIQTAQGFFVEAKSGATSLTFKNSQREANTVGQFFKTKQVAASSKIWLNATNVAGDFSQMAVTYFDGATVGLDAFDGKYINDSAFALTSNANNGEYTIQGRPAFDVADVVALNFKTELAGDYTIAIDHSEGVFASGQDIYLVDSKTGAETNLKTSLYNFTAVAGIDNARFSLKYQKTLKVDDAIFNENSVTVYAKNGSLYVNSGELAIDAIQVYDIQGRLIAERKNVKANTATLDNLKANNQVLLVKVSSENNQVVTKKVVN